MAVEFFGEDVPPSTETVHWRDGVYGILRPAPAEFGRRLRRRYSGSISEKKAEAVRMDASESMVRDHATYVLVNTQGFVFKSRSPEVCHAMGEALAAEVLPDAEVSLDGKWTDKVKAVVFRYAPKFAQWCSAEAIKLEKLGAEEEDITTGN